METILEIIRNDEGEIQMNSRYYDIDADDSALLRDIQQGFYTCGSEVVAASELISLALMLSHCMFDLPVEQMPKPRLRITAQMSRHPSLFEDLRRWRNGKAAEKEIPPFTIFNNKVLLGISNSCPQTEEELLEVKGFGPATMGRYGAEILAITTAIDADSASPRPAVPI